MLAVVFFAGVEPVALSLGCASAERNRVNAESAEYLGSLTYVAESVGEISCVGILAVLRADFSSDTHVSDV